MQQSCTYGSVRGAISNGRPYRDKSDRRLHSDRFEGSFQREESGSWISSGLAGEPTRAMEPF